MEMAMPVSEAEESASSRWKLMVMETATKELEMLESNHPNRFNFFKSELKSLIPFRNSHAPSSSVSTQASTSAMKRKRDGNVAGYRRSRRRLCSSAVASQDSTSGEMERGIMRRCVVKEDESVEVALERAKECLQKIHDLKTQLMIC